MAAPSQLVGHTLGHYHIMEQIGAGGMGVVYRAHDEQLERDVAIKVLPVGALVDEAARKRFRKEALTLAKLNHPNIATIFEFSSQENTDYLVTEYISGLTLDHKLASGALSEKEVVSLGIQLAQGLSAAHEHGIAVTASAMEYHFGPNSGPLSHVTITPKRVITRPRKPDSSACLIGRPGASRATRYPPRMP